MVECSSTAKEKHAVEVPPAWANRHPLVQGIAPPRERDDGQGEEMVAHFGELHLAVDG